MSDYSTELNPATLTARTVVTALIAQGVHQVVYCPGSRNAPLAYALADAQTQGVLQVRVVLDERSAGFIALGMARADLLVGRRCPAAVVTTSGTAVANLHPAVAEADAAGIPLLVLSADRPAELVHTGANQTTAQADIFGANLRYRANLPADLSLTLGAQAASAAITGQLQRATAAAAGSFTNDPGPVQVNLQLRPPLTPPTTAIPWIAAAADASAPTLALELSKLPSPVFYGPESTRGVVVAGNCPDPRFGKLAHHCAELLGWPLLAEPTSGARFGDNAIIAYNSLLNKELFSQIETVLVFGHSTLSRPIQALLARPEQHRIVVTERARWTDTAGEATQVVDAWALADELAAGGCTLLENCFPADPRWLARWRQADAQIREKDKQMLAPDFFDAAACKVWESCQGDDQPLLMVGSSMAIRRLDNWASAPRSRSELPVALANRGLAGIDGTISTAVGLAAASGQPVRVLLGDLSFQHDALALTKGELEADVDLQVIVLDDAGGAIFSTLEYGDVSERHTLARYFTTPQEHDLLGLAQAQGVRSASATTLVTLNTLLSEPVQGRSVIRVHYNNDSQKTFR